MKLQVLLWMFLMTQLLPCSEGNEVSETKTRGRRSFLLDGIENIFSSKNDNLASKSSNSILVDSDSFCQGGCRDGWISYGENCYKYVQNQLPWKDAERACQSLVPGGHLTSISSAEQNDFLVNLATYQGQGAVDFWTGGSQKGSSLQWTDGSIANFFQRPLSSLFHFVEGTLGQILNLGFRLCLNINLGGLGIWDGTDCKKRLPFICSYKPDLTPP